MRQDQRLSAELLRNVPDIGSALCAVRRERAAHIRQTACSIYAASQPGCMLGRSRNGDFVPSTAARWNIQHLRRPALLCSHAGRAAAWCPAITSSRQSMADKCKLSIVWHSSADVCTCCERKWVHCGILRHTAPSSLLTCIAAVVCGDTARAQRCACGHTVREKTKARRDVEPKRVAAASGVARQTDRDQPRTMTMKNVEGIGAQGLFIGRS